MQGRGERADTRGMGMRAPVALLAAALVAPTLLVAPVRAASSCPDFPRSHVWRADVSRLPVHPRSADWIGSMGGPSERLHPDFGPSGGPMPYGIPFERVGRDHPKVAVDFLYDDESDPGPYPFDEDTPIEAGSDRHAIMLDTDRCVLYELFDAQHSPSGSTAGSGAVFDLRSNALRPAGWTSADAAGLAIYPGLVRRDEVLGGRIDHAIRVTASRTRRAYVWPARHQAGSTDDPSAPPMGARFRLKAGYDLSGLRADTRVILHAMKTHGLVIADNGSDWFFTGTAEHGWSTAMLDELKAVPAGAFEAVDMRGLRVSRDSGRARTRLRIARVRFDPPGKDARALNGEWVSVRNRGTNPMSLSRWLLRDRAGNRYRFGALVLKPGARVVVHSGRGRDGPEHVYAGRARPWWGNGGDRAALRAPNGTLHDRCSFGGAGGTARC